MNINPSISIDWFSLLIFSFLLIGCVNGGGSNNLPLTPIPKATVEGCFVEDYPDPKTSQYILPYEVGESFLVSQGNCGRFGTHLPDCTAVTAAGVTISCGDGRYSYDFSIPIGVKILAARSGTIIETEERFSNSDYGIGQENFIVIKHSDGTVAFYGHLSPRGIFVEVGEDVNQGEVIGLAGNSGYTGNNPHLHFDVVRPPLNNCGDKDYSGCKTIPITFRNAKPLDGPLIEWTTYEAMPY